MQKEIFKKVTVLAVIVLFIITCNISVFESRSENIKQSSFSFNDSINNIRNENYFNKKSYDLAITNTNDGSISILSGDFHGNFENRTDYPIGPDPKGIYCADFNLDTIIDIASPNMWENQFSIILGNKNGGFEKLLSFKTAGLLPYSITGGDFNKDNYVDLAIPNRNSHSVNIYYGNGKGIFGNEQKLLVGKDPDGIIADDFNLDGFLDLAILNQDDNDVSIFLGNGVGVFTHLNNYMVGRDPCFITTCDFNRDSYPDIAATSQSFGHDNGSVCVLLSTGGGSFHRKSEYLVGGNPSGIAIGDYNSDNLPDLAVTNNNDNFISLLFGIGYGDFGNRQDCLVGNYPLGILTEDFNNDGCLDLAVVNSGVNTVTILFGDGMGNFNEKKDYLVGSKPELIAVYQVHLDKPPLTPTINGPINGKTGTEYLYESITTDPDGNKVYYFLNWGDGNNSGWLGPYESGSSCKAKHTWSEQDNFTIRVKAKDIYNAESDWATLTVTMPYSYNKPIPQLLEKLFQRFPNVFPLLRQLIGY